MDSYIVRCRKDIALDILQHPTVVRPLGLYAESVLDDFEWWLVDDKLLAALKPQGSVVELHIACKFRDRHSVRESMKNGLEWLKFRKFTVVWTTAPDNRKALLNMLTALNFTRAGEGKWELKLL
tara:strand:- start:1118 stop:1489 length:372 start_codon:yes stop_codon:yes gene_type:complete